MEAASVKSSAVEASIIDRAGDRLATMMGLESKAVVPVSSAVETLVFRIADRSARDTTDQAADRGSSEWAIAAGSKDAADDRASDGSIACAALRKVLGLGFRHHHEDGGKGECPVFDCIDHIFDFHLKTWKGCSRFKTHLPRQAVEITTIPRFTGFFIRSRFRNVLKTMSRVRQFDDNRPHPAFAFTSDSPSSIASFSSSKRAVEAFHFTVSFAIMSAGGAIAVQSWRIFRRQSS